MHAIHVGRDKEVSQAKDVPTGDPSAAVTFDPLILIDARHFGVYYVMGVEQGGVEVGGVDMSVYGAVKDQCLLVVASKDQFGVCNDQEVVEPFTGLEPCHGSHGQWYGVDLGNGTV